LSVAESVTVPVIVVLQPKGWKEPMQRNKRIVARIKCFLFIIILLYHKYCGLPITIILSEFIPISRKPSRCIGMDIRHRDAAPKDNKVGTTGATVPHVLFYRVKHWGVNPWGSINNNKYCLLRLGGTPIMTRLFEVWFSVHPCLWAWLCNHRLPEILNLFLFCYPVGRLP